MLFTDHPLKGYDSEREHISRGNEPILQLVKQAGQNVHIFEALSTLMYHFPEDFFEPGIFILAQYFEKGGENNIKDGHNTAFYLDRCIQYYLQLHNTGPLSRKMYEACVLLLSGVIETGSARAYYLREHIVRSRKIAI